MFMSVTVIFPAEGHRIAGLARRIEKRVGSGQFSPFHDLLDEF